MNFELCGSGSLTEHIGLPKIKCIMESYIFAPVGGLEPPTSTRHRRHLSSSDAIWYCFRLLSALLPTELYGNAIIRLCFNLRVITRGVSSRHRREGAKLIPLILVSVVRSSTAGLLVTSATGTNSVPSSRPVSLQVVSAGIHRPQCQSWLLPICQRTYLLSSFAEGVGFEPTSHF